MTTGHEGWREGWREGRQQARQEDLLRLLRLRFDAQVDVAIEQRVASASSEQMLLWLDRVLSAQSLAELLAD